MQEVQKVSPIPRAFLRSPRRVLRKPGTCVPFLLGRILTAPVLAISAALAGVVVLEPIVVFLLPAQPARLLRQWRETKVRGGTDYWIEYQFDRSGFVGHSRVPQEQYQALHVGQPLMAHLIHIGPLGYSALDRTAADYARGRMILWFGTLFALLIGGIFYYEFWLLPSRAHWLMHHGEVTFGAVVEKRISHSQRHFSCSLTYQFKAAGALRARRIRISPQRYDATGVKDLVIILFDPRRPKRNIVYDYCNFVVS